jgi:hypothetical protein
LFAIGKITRASPPARALPSAPPFKAETILAKIGMCKGLSGEAEKRYLMPVRGVRGENPGFSQKKRSASDV